MNKKISIFDTRYTDYDYADYVDWCEINDIEPEGENSYEFDEWCIEETQEITACDWENLKYTNADKNYMPFFVTGTLGLWYGRPEVHSTRIFYGLSEAIKSAIDGVDDYEAYLEDGVVYVNGYHHDGTNCFEIHLLSKKGIDAIQRKIDNDTIHDNDFEVKDYWFKKFNRVDLWG